MDQVGSTPGGVEIPRSLVDMEMQKNLRALPKDRRPAIPTGPDLKSRYMWRVGPRPSNTRFKVHSISLLVFVSLISYRLYNIVVHVY